MRRSGKPGAGSAKAPCFLLLASCFPSPNEGRMPTARINGFHMYYEIAGQGVPLLFVHGGLGGGRGSALFRQHHMPALAQHVRVIAFDRRAAGLSETPTTEYSFERFVT